MARNTPAQSRARVLAALTKINAVDVEHIATKPGKLDPAVEAMQDATHALLRIVATFPADDRVGIEVEDVNHEGKTIPITVPAVERLVERDLNRRAAKDAPYRADVRAGVKQAFPHFSSADVDAVTDLLFCIEPATA